MKTRSDFDELLNLTTTQLGPQRLLFVFAAAELPEDAMPEQRRDFLDGQGDALTPLMCVDKAPAELSDFGSLLAESQKAGPPWQVVFAAALTGSGGAPPGKSQIDAALESMVKAVHAGGVGRFAAFGPRGELLHLEGPSDAHS